MQYLLTFQVSMYSIIAFADNYYVGLNTPRSVCWLRRHGNYSESFQRHPL